MRYRNQLRMRKEARQRHLTFESLEHRRVLTATPFSDGFEGPALDTFWNWTQVDSGNIDFPSSENAHGGDQSVQFNSTNTAETKSIWLGHTFDEIVYGRFSVWMYDTGADVASSNYIHFYAGKDVGLGPEVQIYATDFDLSPTTGGTYVYVGTGIGEASTGVDRTQDWHQFSLELLPGSTNLSIDGSTVYSGTETFNINWVAMRMGAPSWRPAWTTYFDDFEFVPVTPVISGISDDTGVSSTDGITNDANLTVTGTSAANTTVQVYQDGDALGTATADGNGNWSFDHTVTLEDGHYGFTATITDAADNESAPSEEFSVEVDTTSPIVTVGNLTTPDTTPVITGTVSDGALQVAVNGRTYVDGDGHLTITGTNWTLQLPDSDALLAGVYDVAASSTDVAGNLGHDETADELTVETLRVTSLTPTPSGFRAAFNWPIDESVINLYEGAARVSGDPDVKVLSPDGIAVSGSLIVSTDGRQVEFMATGGPLAGGQYAVTFDSRDNAFREAGSGALLDGNADGTSGDSYNGTFEIAPVQPLVVSVPDFTRGPLQPVDVPATRTGLPIWLSDVSGVESVDVVLHYDPMLLSVEEVLVGPDLSGIANVTANLETPGQITFFFYSVDELPPGPIEIVTLVAEVPDSAPYGAAHVLDIVSVSVNEDGLDATADDAIHTVAYFGDTTGNQDYSGLDAQRAARVGVGLDTGFDAYPTIDPHLLADITGNGSLSGLDAQKIARHAVGLHVPEIPQSPEPLRLTGPLMGTVQSRPLTDSQLAHVVEMAAARTAPIDHNAPAVFHDVTFEVTDLPGDLLGLTRGHHVQFDIDAAGYGWFIDSTPWDDAEFGQPNGDHELSARPGSPAADRADLLTVVMHELGHVLGYGHADDGVMEDSLPLGTRRAWDDVSPFDHGEDWEAEFRDSSVTAELVDDYFAITEE